VWLSALGALIAAAQLVPTLELTRQSIRSAGLSFGDAAAFSLPPTNLLTTLRPTIGQPPKTTEWLGYVGLVTLLLAGYGLFHRHTAEAITLAVLALVGVASLWFNFIGINYFSTTSQHSYANGAQVLDLRDR